VGEPDAANRGLRAPGGHPDGRAPEQGRIDRLALPPALRLGGFLAALLGDEEKGRWQIAPAGHLRRASRRYRGETLVLETDFDTAEGSIRLVDFMPPRGKTTDVVRLVVGVRGQVRVQMDFRPRFDYGRIRPRLRRIDGADVAIAGAESIWLRAAVETRTEDDAVRADFFVSAGELLPFVLTWHPWHEPAPVPVDPLRALADTESFWADQGRAAVRSGTALSGSVQLARSIDANPR
jgi:GH15 family glucan-1,4-alpha-glucosidase